MHEALLPATAQYADGPAKEDDGKSHAHEASRHPTQIWGRKDT